MPLALFYGRTLTLLVYAVGENKSTKGAALCSRLPERKSLKHGGEALVHCKRSPVGKNTGWFAG